MFSLLLEFMQHILIFIMAVLKTVIALLLSHVSLFLLIDFSVDYGQIFSGFLHVGKFSLDVGYCDFFRLRILGLFVFYLKSVGLHSDVWLSYLEPV